MNLAILSCGPSLKRFLDNPVEHDGYMGVNRAAGAYPCNWWVGVDRKAFSDTDPIGAPTIYTQAHHDVRYPIPKRCPVIQHEQAFDGVKAVCSLGSTPWRRWSAVYALVVAGVLLKATKLTLYGFDMKGHLFWDGVAIYRDSFIPPPKTMDDVRWQHERSYHNSVVEWLIRRGVEVERV